MVKANQYTQDKVELKPVVDRLKSKENTEELIEPLASEEDIYIKMKYLREKISKDEYEYEQLEWRLKISIACSKGINGIATWKSLHKARFDGATFKEEHPDLHSRYCVETIERRFVIS